jgi:hypothetical protein
VPRGIVSCGVKCLWVFEADMGPPAVATRRPALLAPDGFPPFSWPTGVVYDVDLDIVTVVTLGGEGFFYRYDARKKQWLDYRSLNNIDITSIAYDPQAKRYAAWTSEGALLSLSSKGEPLGRTKDLKSQLTGFGALYDRGNARPPPLMLAPRRFPSRVAAPLRKPTPDTTSAERPRRSAADWRYRPTADIAPDGSDSSKAVVRIPAVPSPMREAAGAGGIRWGTTCSAALNRTRLPVQRRTHRQPPLAMLIGPYSSG